MGEPQELSNSDSTTSSFTASENAVPLPYSGVDESQRTETSTSKVYNAFYVKDETVPPSTPEEEANKGPIPIWRKALAILRPGYIIDHLDYNSFKIAIRTWVQIWVSVVLCIIPKTSHWLGAAAYLTQIMGFISVSGGTSVILNVITALLAFFYCIAAWLIATIAMKIVNRFHNYITMEELAQQLISEGKCTPQNIEECLLLDIFQGHYIKTKSAAIYCLALISGMVIFGMSTKIHRLARIGFITGMITLIINCCYGIFFPVFVPKINGEAVMIPMGVSFAIKIVCSILVYPSSSSFTYFGGSTKILSGIKAASANNLRFIKSMKPSVDTFTNYQNYSKDIMSLRAKSEALEFFVSTIRFEVSYGRFDKGDAGEFRSLLKNFMSVSAGSTYFYQLLEERKEIARNNFINLARKNTSTSTADHRSKLNAIRESYKHVGEYEYKTKLSLFKKNYQHIAPEERISLADLDHIADFIRRTFFPLAEVVDLGLATVIQWLSAANQFRIYAVLPGQYKKHVAKQKEMAEKIKEIKEKILHQLERYKNDEKLEQVLRSEARNEEMLLCLISQSSLFLHLAKIQCKTLLNLIDFFISMDELHPEPRIVTPFTFSSRASPSHIERAEVGDDEFPSYLQEGIRRRNPDSRPPSNFYQRIGVYLAKVFKLLYDEHFWFWVRSGGLVCIAATPYFVRTTAHWYYSNRFIWLVIMVSVSTAENTGETMYVFWSKLFYTFFGCLLGMVGWYISAGNGHGNYYGYGAVTAVIYLYMAYYRHFSVHLSLVPSILFGVTTALVMGTSWVDVKYGFLANVGGGIRVAYLRFLSVVIGLSIGFLACLLPRPVTSKTMLRSVISTILSEVGNIHCNVARFAAKRIEDPSVHILLRHDLILEKFRHSLMKLAKVSGLFVALQHEIPITGFWPEAKYRRLQRLIADVIQLYFLLFQIFNQVEDPVTWVPRILKRIGWADAALNASVFSNIHMASDSLRTKNPLPKISEANTSVRHLEMLISQWGINQVSLSERFYNDEAKRKKTSGDNAVEEFVDNLDIQKFLSIDGQNDVVAVLFAHMIYKRIDEIMIIVKGLVGEKYDYDTNLFDDEESEITPMLETEIIQ
ncbi:uncharacterized protein RJT20DRAFT_64115 [Scheffersomyces xylosifermentans]|uniref:uncharacterized protein n=1 Tax=Scheffersomyces xylosifermentans TaxID=1304137 RepID=UPI00315D4452